MLRTPYRMLQLCTRCSVLNMAATRKSGFSVTEKSRKMQYIVGHDKVNREFYVKIEKDSQVKALLQYEIVRKDIVNLYHTEVPEAYQGKGIAKCLAKAALDHFVAEDLKLRLDCWFVQKYVDENPLAQYTERLVPQS
ncbi:protein NATD1-like [Saccoglossus kowalevskii]